MKIYKAPMASEFTEVPNLPPLKFSFVLPEGYPTVGFEIFLFETKMTWNETKILI